MFGVNGHHAFKQLLVFHASSRRAARGQCLGGAVLGAGHSARSGGDESVETR
jgi:hypothetical protein